jgi:hypothetical protein
MKQAASFAIVAAALICVAAVCATSGYAKGWMDGYDQGIEVATTGVKELIATLGEHPIDYTDPEKRAAVEQFKANFLPVESQDQAGRTE